MSDKQERGRGTTAGGGGSDAAAGATGLGAGAASLGAGVAGLGGGAAQLQGAAEASARLSRDMIERAGEGFEVMRRIGEALGEGARAAAGEVSGYVAHTAQRQQEMVQRLAQARSPADVLEVQTRYYQDNLRELFGLAERLSRGGADAARQAGRQVGGADEGPGRA